jgi:hypothetical protein
MTFSNSTILSVVELALYLVLTPITAFLAFRHHLHGLLGHFYLNIFCVIRVVADIVAIAQRNHDPSKPTIINAVLSSIGLSPLILALAGFIHETHRYQVVSSLDYAAAKRLTKFMWIAQLQFHLVAGAGIALIVVASINLATAETQSDVNSDYHKREIGAVLIFATWTLLAVYAALVWRKVRNTAEVAKTSLSRLATCVVLATPAIGIRAVYSMVFAFDHSPSVSPITGNFAIKLILVVLVQLIAVLFMIQGSWISRGIVREHSVRYEPLQRQDPHPTAVELNRGQWRS